MPKQRVDSVTVHKIHDSFIVTENNDTKHVVYQDDFDKIVEILKNTDESEFKNGLITPEHMKNKLSEIRPKLKNEFFLRDTDSYYKYYSPQLKILDYERYINYYKDGTIEKLKKFKELSIKPIGIDKYV